MALFFMLPYDLPDELKSTWKQFALAFQSWGPCPPESNNPNDLAIPS